MEEGTPTCQADSDLAVVRGMATEMACADNAATHPTSPPSTLL